MTCSYSFSLCVFYENNKQYCCTSDALRVRQNSLFTHTLCVCVCACVRVCVCACVCGVCVSSIRCTILHTTVSGFAGRYGCCCYLLHWGGIDVHVDSMVHIKMSLCCCRLGATCNHIAALLFKIDYACQHGLTQGSNRPCTSMENKWMSPALVNLEPVKASDMTVENPR